tara:strand:+ start:335 stop:1561 length:1227 start_codon:yes stop_codon:yes gene_type:complete
LIVKEINTEEGFYAYIQEYRMDETWFASEGSTINMTTYTGKMIFYTLEGVYVARVTFTGGEIVDDHLRSPCPDDPTNGDPGPGGGNSGPGPGGTGGNPAGSDPQIAFGWICNWRGVMHSDPSECNNPGMGGSWVIYVEMPQVRAVCDPEPDECVDENDDPCTLGCNSEGECIEENDGTIMNLATNPCEKLNVISQYQDFMDNINELNTASNNMQPGTKREKGYAYEGPVTDDNTTFVQSQPDDPNLDFTLSAGTAISAFIHNHFFLNQTDNNGNLRKSLNIFSDDDIISLYKIAKNNNIQLQYLGFPFILVYQGNMYHLEISDSAAFVNLGDLLFLEDNGKKTRVLRDEFTEYNIKNENSATTNMNNLAKLLQNHNFGLELYQSPVNNPNWRKVKVNPDNTVSLEDCN